VLEERGIPRGPLPLFIPPPAPVPAELVAREEPSKLAFDLEHDEREKLAHFVSNGGVIIAGYDDEGPYAMLEGTPQVEAEGATIVKALRQLADMLEEASR
jgi:hypothetical protein